MKFNPYGCLSLWYGDTWVYVGREKGWNEERGATTSFYCQVSPMDTVLKGISIY